MTSWTDYQDEISDAISDSMDMDWSANDGARAVVRWLNENKPLSTAPRVTVPVEPTEAMLDSWHKAVESGIFSQTPHSDYMRSAYRAMLSATPAPEGGAVWFGVSGAADETEALAVALFDARCPGIRMTDEDLHYYRAAAQRAMRAVSDELDTPALATREVSPAEAGEIGAEYDDAVHCVTLAECPPGLFLWNGTLGFKSEYGAMEPVGISPHHQQWKVGNRVDAYCADSGEYFWGGTSNHDDRAKLLVYPISAETVAMVASHGPSALRAQPQAREDAQPFGWISEHVLHHMGPDGKEMIYGSKKAANYREDAITLYTTPPAPEAEKLRGAVEALEPFAEIAGRYLAGGLRADLDARAPSLLNLFNPRDFYRAHNALAALQAEQKGGA